jgi:hypothetical protein
MDTSHSCRQKINRLKRKYEKESVINCCDDAFEKRDCCLCVCWVDSGAGALIRES